MNNARPEFHANKNAYAILIQSDDFLRIEILAFLCLLLANFWIGRIFFTKFFGRQMSLYGAIDTPVLDFR